MTAIAEHDAPTIKRRIALEFSLKEGPKDENRGDEKLLPLEHRG